MSVEVRNWVVAHPHTHFADDLARQDLRDPAKTNTDLVGLIVDLLNKGHIIYFTAVNSDHHDDSALGPHSHRAGMAFDCWPMNSDTPGDFCDTDSPKMLKFLRDAAVDPKYYQTGLGGSAWNHTDIVAAGRGVFQDNGSDHVHLGVI